VVKDANLQVVPSLRGKRVWAELFSIKGLAVCVKAGLTTRQGKSVLREIRNCPIADMGLRFWTRPKLRKTGGFKLKPLP
jgi:hypothetical protein